MQPNKSDSEMFNQLPTGTGKLLHYAYADLPTSGVQNLYSLIPKVVFYWQKLYS